MAAPLKEKVKENNIWSWTEKDEKAFREIIEKISRAEPLGVPNFDKPFHRC